MLPERLEEKARKCCDRLDLEAGSVHFHFVQSSVR